MKHYFIENPVSGKNHPGNIIEDLVRPAAVETGIDFEIYTTKRRGDATAFVKEKCSEANGAPVRFYAVGGDGTLYEVVNGVVGFPNAEVTCVPKGSGNDYIRLYGGKDFFLDVKDLINGTVLAVDGLRLDDGTGVYEYAINQASMGFDAEACAYQSEMKKIPGSFGHISYLLAGLYCMFTKAYNTFACEVDGEPVHGPFFLAAACSSRWYASGIKVAPFADPCDGLLDFVIIRRDMWWPSLFKLAIYDWQTKGTHYLSKSCLYMRGRKMVCRPEHPMMLNTDGESRLVEQITMEAVPNCFNFVIPSHSPYLKGAPGHDIDTRKRPSHSLHIFDKVVNHGIMGYGRKRY